MGHDSPTSGSGRKHHVLSRHSPSTTRSIAEAVVLKDGGIFLVVDPDGAVPLSGRHGCGLYWKDVRWLEGYEIGIDGVVPDVLFADASAGNAAAFQLSNAGLVAGGGRREVGIALRRSLTGPGQALRDRFELRNFGMSATECELQLGFRAGFDDVFVVRGLLDEADRPPVDVAWEGDTLRFRRDGIDGTTRVLEIRFSPAPSARDAVGVRFQLHLEPGATHTIHVTVSLHEHPRGTPPGLVEAGHPAEQEGAAEDPAAWRTAHVGFHSDSVLLDRIVARAVGDLGMLRMRVGGSAFFAAGLPWFGTLFGRDSAITAMQTLAWNPVVAAETLRVLTRFQGTRIDRWRDEEPGKILHELRRGELARAGEIPHTPYYGTVDATPLFLCLFVRTLAWTGNRALFHELAPAVDAALGWIDAATAGDGWIWYGSARNEGLANQGWKDSGDAIVNADGTLAEPPIALVEVQGYVYRAWAGLASIYTRLGDTERGAALGRRAEALRQRIRARFRLGSGRWALALQRGLRPCAGMSSNPGHLLWCGVVDAEEARALGERLAAPDMYTGWGVRTLTTDNPRYNPVGYHIGTVWPHDNSILAAGLRRYGRDDEAARLCDSMLEACTWFESMSMPELFAGFSREEYERPVPYPVACRPQAWGAGAVLGMLHTLLGLVPDAFAGRLRIVRPRLPALARALRLEGLRVGDARVDLRFHRVGADVDVELLHKEGPLEVVVEQGTGARTLGGWV